MTHTEHQLQWVEWLLSRGMHLHPCDHPALPTCAGLHTTHPCDGKRGKHPCGRWTKLATNDPDQLRAMFSAGPRNIGIACGPSGLLVVDEDRPSALAGYVAEIGQAIPPTLTISTGRGRHYYFRAPEGVALGNAVGALKGRGIDIRGSGGYVIGPGSLHETGALYLPVDPDAAILPAPAWLIEALQTKPSAVLPLSTPQRPPIHPSYTSELERALARNTGDRSADFAAVVGACKRAGLTPDETTSLLINMQHPAVEKYNGRLIAEVDRFWGKASERRERHTSNRPRSRDEQPATATEASDVSDSVLVEQAAHDVLRGRFRWCPGLGWLQWDSRRWATVDDAVVAEVIRTYLAERFTQKVTEAGPTLTHQRLRELRHMLTATKVRNVATLARGMNGIYTTAAELDSDPDLLNTPSGVVNLRTGQLRPHDPDLLITKITLGSYRPGYTHPDWEKALEALPPAERDWYQVRVGQAITGHPTPDGVLVLLQGGGENGKSLLTTDGVVPALGDYADVASHKLLSATDEHSEEMASLRGQRFLISEEMTEGRALNVATIKRIMDVGEIRARHVYKSNMTFRATHSLFATTNYLPVVNETDHGTWRRLALLRFPYTFRKPGEECRRPDEKPGDPQLKSRIRAGRGGQHDAIVTWAVEGARRWYANPDTSLALTEQIATDTRAWRVEADRILGYWGECLIPDPNACIITKELVEDFNEWLMANGHQPWSKELFHPRFKAHSETNRHGVVERRTLNPTGLSRRHTKRFDPTPARPTVYVGVRFRTETDGELEQVSDQQQHTSARPARPHPNFSKPRGRTEKVSEWSGRSGRNQTTSVCTLCGTLLDPVLAAAGDTTHPTCDPRAA